MRRALYPIRYTWSALFKREYQMQGGVAAGAEGAAMRSRVGARVPPGGDARDAVFSQLEPRLSGKDAADAFIQTLGLRLERECVHSLADGATGAARRADAGARAALPPALVGHGPPVPPQPAVSFAVPTRGVQ